MSESEIETVPAPLPEPGEVLTPLESYADHVAAWRELDSRTSWVKGDIAASLETRYGEGRLQEFAHDVDEEYATVKEYRRVARAYPQKARRLAISWSAHQTLASQDDRVQLLAAHEWTVAQARVLVESRKHAALPQPVAPRSPAPEPRAGGDAPHEQAKRQDGESPAATEGDRGQDPARVSNDVPGPPEVANIEAHAWNVKELRRLCRQVAQGKGGLSDSFYAPLPQFGEPSRLIKKRSHMGEVYESHWSKPRPHDVTGDSLIAATLRVLACGAEGDTAADPRKQAALALARLNDAQSKLAELETEVARLTAERDEVRAQHGVPNPIAKEESVEAGDDTAPEPVPDVSANWLAGEEAAGREALPGAFDDPFADALTGGAGGGGLS
jgi:hypothetical protein